MKSILVITLASITWVFTVRCMSSDASYTPPVESTVNQTVEPVIFDTYKVSDSGWIVNEAPNIIEVPVEDESEESKFNEPKFEEIPIEDEPDVIVEDDKIVCDWLGYELTEDEFNLLCTTVFCESGGESYNTQVMVCLTILNRIASDKFPDDIRGVIYAKNAYSVTRWKDFENRGWTDQVEDAVTYALSKNEHPRNMYYFRTRYYHGFARDYMNINDMYFSVEP